MKKEKSQVGFLAKRWQKIVRHRNMNRGWTQHVDYVEFTGPAFVFVLALVMALVLMCA